MSGRYLIDTSALARRSHASARAVLDELSSRGLLAICGAVELRVLGSARSEQDATRIRDLMRGFDRLPTPEECWGRALEVQRLLIDGGKGRAVSLPELVIAATAERHGATVLHCDGTYDMIAAVTGQPTRWVAPPGTGG
jgi:hypothetical protein